ncbi:MAG: penicillin-binding protein 2 [Leptolyngbya sp. SIO1E4]|nr:penicillin-binding protein 2 [Leptolyngbya sp. SIO1E4]
MPKPPISPSGRHVRSFNSRRRRRKPRFSPRFRIAIVWSLLFLAVIGLMVRLAQLQLFRGETLAAIAQQQQARETTPNISRSPIVDSQGTPLAVDRLVYTLYGHPALFRQPIGVVAQTLSPLLEIPPETLKQRLQRQKTGVRLFDEIPEETARRIQQLRLDGLELLPNQQRFYPQQESFSQVVGFVNLEGEAQTGLEAQYQDRLRLPTPSTPSVSGPALPVAHLPGTAPLQLQLTLDNHLQRVVQEALRQTIRQFGAKRGTVMVMDVNTGALHAFAVEPTFDPNRYFDADLSWLKNWAITDVFEPGSTFKPINIAIALETQAIGLEDVVYDEGQIKIDKWTIQNSDYESTGQRGTLTLTDVLKHSSNVGMVHIMERLSASEFYGWLEKLEVDQPTGIELPAENAAPLKARSQFVNSPADAATAAFGQGIVMTPLKLLQLEAAIANGGKLVTPHVLHGFVDEMDTVHWQPPRPAPRRVFSEETAQAVLSMMESVVEEGTGKSAQIPGYRIAGKTGTAQKVTDAGDYGDGLITSFIGLLPVEAPRFAVLAVIDEPLGPDTYGSTVSAPLVKTVMESLVVLEGIPPSSPQALGGVVVPPETLPNSAPE